MEEEKSVSIMDILHVLKKNLLLVIIVTLVITIIGSCLIALVYNKAKNTYSATFDSSFVNMDKGQYPDGTTYNVKDIISYDALSKIASADEFKSIDIQTMLDEDDISLNIDEKTAATSISVKAKYFEDADQARAFIYAIVSNPIDKSNIIVSELNYTANITAYDNCTTTYSDKIAYLQKQKSYLNSLYDNLIESVGENYVVNNDALGTLSGSTLKQLKLRLDEIMKSDILTYAKNQLELNKYVINADVYAKNAVVETALIDEKIVQNNKRIAYLQKALDDLVFELSEKTLNDPSEPDKHSSYTITNRYELQEDNSFLAEIHALSLQNANYEIEKDQIEKTLINSTDAAIQASLADFESTLSGFVTELESETQITKAANISVYKEQSSVYLQNKISAEGGINVILGVFISLLVGFILIAIIVCIKDLPKYLKEKNAVKVEVKVEE